MGDVGDIPVEPVDEIAEHDGNIVDRECEICRTYYERGEIDEICEAEYAVIHYATEPEKMYRDLMCYEHKCLGMHLEIDHGDAIIVGIIPLYLDREASRCLSNELTHILEESGGI